MVGGGCLVVGKGDCVEGSWGGWVAGVMINTEANGERRRA